MKKAKLPTLYASGSFLCLWILMAATTPGQNIIFSTIFFILLLVFLISLGYLLTSFKGSGLERRRYRVVIVSLFFVIALMFTSSQSFSWVDGLILILTVVGLIFYADRRFTSQK